MKKFILFKQSATRPQDREKIYEKYLGKAYKIFFLGKFGWARQKRWCDISYDDIVLATRELVELEISMIKKYQTRVNVDSVIAHWSDIMADKQSESELEPIVVIERKKLRVISPRELSNV